MTLKELSQLYYLNKEIKDNEKRLEALKNMEPSSPEISGMPHAKGGISSPTERMAIEKTDLQAIIAAQHIQVIHEQARIMRFITEIPDSINRLIFTYRFVDLLSWEEVAAALGGGNTVESVKKRCYRYLDKVNEGLTEGDRSFLTGSGIETPAES